MLNGWYEGNEEGEITCFSNRESVIDYGIVNCEGLNLVRRLEVGCRIDSDHMPLDIRIKCDEDIGRKKECREKK